MGKTKKRAQTCHTSKKKELFTVSNLGNCQLILLNDMKKFGGTDTVMQKYVQQSSSINPDDGKPTWMDISRLLFNYDNTTVLYATNVWLKKVTMLITKWE